MKTGSRRSARVVAPARRELGKRVVQDEKLPALCQFAAGVAHDVDNALSAIVGHAEQLRASLAGEGRADAELRDLDVILQAAGDAGQTVRRLLEFADPANANGVDQRRPVAPDALLVDVVAFTRPRWRDKASAEGRRIEVRLQPGGAPLVLADPVALREALVNLLNNAADALPAGGQITITSGAASADDGSSQAVLSVVDNGVGMGPATRRRVFEPFFTTKPAGKGMGLGMAMVQGIVARLGGSVQVASEPNKGTSVTVRLPAMAPQPVTAPAVRGPAPNRHVLLVEDEVALRAVVDRMLSAEGHTVSPFGSAEAALEALEQAASGAFHVVVTDVGLPGMSGWQFLKALRDQYRHLPVVVATGWAGQMDEHGLDRSDISRDQLIGKPYRRDELLAALGHALNEVKDGDSSTSGHPAPRKP